MERHASSASLYSYMWPLFSLCRHVAQASYSIDSRCSGIHATKHCKDVHNYRGSVLPRRGSRYRASFTCGFNGRCDHDVRPSFLPLPQASFSIPPSNSPTPQNDNRMPLSNRLVHFVNTPSIMGASGRRVRGSPFMLSESDVHISD